MTERPILFSGPMVRAILDGRKTQTRRVVKLQGADAIEERVVGASWPWSPQHDEWLACPYGEPGDRLWVRETWAHDGSKAPPLYRASWQCKRDYPGVPCEHGPDRWRPPIYMPRWASRLTLEVTGVRVERLNDISEEDAVAEGVEVHMMPEEWRAVRQQHGRNEAITFDRELSADLIAALRLRDVTHVPARPMRSAVSGFSSLWESINGAGSWDADPWVWCVAFKRVTP